MVDSSPEVDSALLGSTVGTLLSVYEGLGAVYSAMLGLLWRRCYASVTWCFCLTAQKTVDILQLPFIAGRRFPVVVHRPIPMVLPLEDHRNSAVAVFAWWSMFLLCTSCSMPFVVDTCPSFKSCRKFVEGSAVAVPPGCGTSLYYAATSCLATVKVPLIQFIAGVSGHFSRHRDR